MIPPYLFIGLLLTLSFTLAIKIGLWREQSDHTQTRSGGVMEILMGDSRRLFANHFITKADVYLHSGVYPSIFDQAQQTDKLHLAKEAESEGRPSSRREGEDHDGEHEEHAEHDNVAGFLGKPRDWIDAFGRNFIPTEHRHLENKHEQRELLPWFKLAAELDPNEVNTYTVAAYWLRRRMSKVPEAEAFLREGWRANPESYQILFELGRLYEEDSQDDTRAENLLRAALGKWQANQAGKEKRDDFGLMQILGHLARIEARQGRLDQAIQHLEQLREISPSAEELGEQIGQLKARMSARSSNAH